MKRTTLTLALALLATPLLAQSALIPEQILRIKAANLVCNANTEGKMYRVVDASSHGDCDPTGGGTVSALCLCDNLSFVPIAVDTDLAASYVPVTKAGQQSITATGAGNDVTITAEDGVFMYAGGGAEVGGYLNLSPTTTGLYLATGGEGFYAQENLAGIEAPAISVDAAGGVDEIVITEGVTTVTGALNTAAANGSYTAAIDVNVGVDFATVSLTATDGSDTSGFTVEPSGSRFSGLVRLVPAATPPAVCAAGTEGGLYLDSDTHLLCVCNATGWVQVADGTTGCS